MVSFISTLAVPALALASLANAFDFDTSVSLINAPISHPILSAITVRSHLQSREEAFVPKEDCVHHYAEDKPSLSGGRSRFVKTHTKYKLPALVLEDIEMVVGGIECTRSSITLQFPDRQTLDAIRPSWDNLGAFFVISSHPGCNADGERAPYLVSGIHYDLQKETAEFAVQSVTFKDAFKTMTVKFGAQLGQYPASSFRTHEGLRKRQAVGFSSVIRSASSTSIVSSTRAASLSSSRSASLTATRVSSSSAKSSPSQKPNFMVHADIAKGLNATDRFDPNQVLFEQEFTQTGGSTESLKIACKDCSIGGTIDIVDGEFTVSEENNVISEAIDFYKDGFIRAVVNNMTAHIALEAALKLATKKEFEKTLIEVGIPGFQIPGIVTVGPTFRPVFTSSIELNGDLSFSTGFEIKVPDNSTITLGIAKIVNSTLTGFQNTKVSTLPFQATSPSVTLSLTAGIRADLSFGLSFFNGQGKADVGAFFDIPTLKITISTGTNFDEDCKPVVTNLTSLNSATQIMPFKFPSLVLVEFLVILDVGVQAEATLNFPGNFDPGTKVSTELAGTTFSLSNSCLSFDASKTKFVKPTVPVTSTAVVPGATGGNFAEVGKGGNGNATATPGIISGAGKSRDLAGSLWWSGAGLLSVFFVALAL